MKHERVLLLTVLVLLLLVVGYLSVTFATKLGNDLGERIDPPTTTTFPGVVLIPPVSVTR